MCCGHLLWIQNFCGAPDSSLWSQHWCMSFLCCHELKESEPWHEIRSSPTAVISGNGRVFQVPWYGKSRVHQMQSGWNQTFTFLNVLYITFSQYNRLPSGWMSKAGGYEMPDLGWLSGLYQTTSLCRPELMCLCLLHIYVFLHDYSFRPSKSCSSSISLLLLTLALFSSSKFVYIQSTYVSSSFN